MTYRYRGHSMSDPAKYRTKEEVQEMRERARPDRSPAQAADRRRASADEDEFKQIDKEIRDIVNEAASFAQDSPEPDPDRAVGPTSISTSSSALDGSAGTRAMPTEILMPALSPTMTEGNLAKWLKKEGDTVASGDVIAEIETDKATMEVEAVDEGTLGKILVAEGTEGVTVNTPIALLLGRGRGRRGARSGGGRQPRPPRRPSSRQPAPRRTAKAGSRPRAERRRRAAGEPRPAEPEVPAGTEMVKQTVREALRDAMAEEMRRDPDVFLMGEEVAEYQGAYKVSQGLLEEFGAEAGDRHADHRARLRRPRRRRGHGRPEADRRVHDLELRHAGDRPHHQLGRQDAATWPAASWAARSCSAAPTAPPRASAAQHSQEYSTWYAHCPGLKVVAPYTRGRRQGPAQGRDPRPQPGRLPRERDALRPELRGARSSTTSSLPIGKAQDRCATGSDVTIVAFSLMVERALKAAEKLAEEGIEAEVIDLRTLRPLDIETIVESVKKTNRLVSVEEGWPQLGMGAEIAAVMMEQAFD